MHPFKEMRRKGKKSTISLLIHALKIVAKTNYLFFLATKLRVWIDPILVFFSFPQTLSPPPIPTIKPLHIVDSKTNWEQIAKRKNG